MLSPLVEGFVVESLTEIRSEFGEEKKILVESLLQSRDSEHWTSFIHQITGPFLKKISVPTRVIPSNQYEEQLKELNQILNNKETYEKLLCAFNLLNSNAEVSKHVPGMVLFRLCSKMIDKLVQFVFHEMKRAKSTPDHGISEMSELEKEAFCVHIRKLLQDYYKRGLRHGSQLWLSRCACIRQKFIESNDASEPPSVDMVLDNRSWVTDSDGCSKLKLTETCVKFFLSVEKIVESRIYNKEESVTCDIIVNIVLKDTDMLDAWHSLTMLYFSEVEALVFMKDLIIIVTNLSLRLEVGRVRDMQVNTKRVQKYALRTDLKRN